MQQQNSGMSCQLGSWALAAGVGLLVFILLLVIGDWGWLSSLFTGALAFVVLGFLFNWLFCNDVPGELGSDEAEASSGTASASARPPWRFMMSAACRRIEPPAQEIR